MNPAEEQSGAAEEMTNKQQKVTPTSQPMNDAHEMRKGEEKPTEEGTKQEPVLTMTPQEFMEASLDIIRRRNAAAAELGYLERQALAGLESDETLKSKSELLKARLEALISEQLRLRDYNRRS
ncbi:hypothetical protein N7486_009633 [Penicillium sp. IBT 16267x]|nr:hypothetical protein N7486_009633 [Penicillium sp. IBT 16267x]